MLFYTIGCIAKFVATVVDTVNFISPRIIIVIIVDFHREAVSLRRNVLVVPLNFFLASPSGQPSYVSPSTFSFPSRQIKKEKER